MHLQGNAERVVHRAIHRQGQSQGADHRAGPVRVPDHGRRHRAHIVRVHHVRRDARGRALQQAVASVRMLRAAVRLAVHAAVGPRGPPAADDRLVCRVFRIRRGHIRVLLRGPVHRAGRHRVRMAVRAGGRRPVRRAYARPRLAAVDHQLRTVPVQRPVHSQRGQHDHADRRVVPRPQAVPRARPGRRHVPQLSDIVAVQPRVGRVLLAVAARDQRQDVRRHSGPAQEGRRRVLNAAVRPTSAFVYNMYSYVRAAEHTRSFSDYHRCDTRVRVS